MQRVVVVVKYFPPYPRISGVLTFIALLVEQLGRRGEVHVVTAAMPDDVSRPETIEHCTVHRVGWPFPLTAARQLRRLGRGPTLCVSGIYDLEQAATYFAPVLGTARWRGAVHLYQATWPTRPPRAVFGAVARRLDGVLCASRGIDELMRSGGVAASVVEPAVDLAALAAAASDARLPGADSQELRIGFVNHLNEVKGADVALGAFERLAAGPDALSFTVAGEGDLADELRARHGDLPRTTFAGFLPDAERMAALAACDVMLLPFRRAESVLGVSQTALEVMALGNVVVGTDTASISAAIRHDHNGVLIDPAALDAAHLADVVTELVRDPERLARLRARAATDAEAKWDVARRADELFELLVGT